MKNALGHVTVSSNLPPPPPPPLTQPSLVLHCLSSEEQTTTLTPVGDRCFSVTVSPTLMYRCPSLIFCISNTSSGQPVMSSFLNFLPTRSLISQSVEQFSHQVLLESTSGLSVTLSPMCVWYEGERERERERVRVNKERYVCSDAVMFRRSTGKCCKK